MRNAALMLGIIGGIIGMIVGFFSYGYTEMIDRYGEVEGLFEQVTNPEIIRAASFVSPLLAIAGGAMARARALWGGVLMLLSAAGMIYAFGFNAFTMFPIGFVGIGGLLAIAAGKPDEPKAHF
ncbi:hypothetical protein [Thalassovita aquimarina]|uniref:Major facilitator superfamily (MFS) profile domain-containing protein n=1 Tax=Thalassovita aquimarina TaxID=2785917 RepID=A0ABS5HRX2_9RHOB|nr:hypothetical protein [Thalassovita aquimarina]MBR9651668.1 hypothetical protein [Thalassovita aquimarina]